MSNSMQNGRKVQTMRPFCIGIYGSVVPLVDDALGLLFAAGQQTVFDDLDNGREPNHALDFDRDIGISCLVNWALV